MKIYLTKPAHTKYGLIPLKKYESIKDLIDESFFWFVKPVFAKPFICFLTDEFGWPGFSTDYQCSGQIKDFPEGEVKEAMKTMVRESIDDNFHENLPNRHYKWIGELEVDIVSSETAGNFNLYLTKPDVWDIQFAGIDRAMIWLYPPKLIKQEKLYKTDKDYYKFDGVVGIKGNYFRKFANDTLGIMFWMDIVNSFDVSYENVDDFYRNINDENHKKDQSSTQFIKTYYFNLFLRGVK